MKHTLRVPYRNVVRKGWQRGKEDRQQGFVCLQCFFNATLLPFSGTLDRKALMYTAGPVSVGEVTVPLEVE